MDQLTFEDLEQLSPSVKEQGEKLEKVYGPQELTKIGKKYTKQDVEQWEAMIWKIQRLERAKDNWINWFEAIELYQKMRDAEE